MKRTLGIFLLMTLLFAFVCTPASAEMVQVTAPGFYEIGTADDVTITPKASSGSVKTVTADIDNDSVDETFYANSDMLTVEYTDASATAHYGVVLVEGNELPNKDNEIFYIDQVTAVNNKVTFNVYPLLPTKNTDLTLYISSSDEDFDLITIRLKYTIAGTYEYDNSYVLGDVDNNGEIASLDAQHVLKHVVRLEVLEGNELLAADVDGNGEIASLDAQRILKHVVRLELIK